MVELCMAILLFKPKNCHQPSTFEEAIVVMEAYASAEVGHYLILKTWKVKTNQGCAED